MERLLRPEHLDADPRSSSAVKEWMHLFKTFQNFLAALAPEGLNKLSLLTNFVTPKIYETIVDCTTYEDAVQTLQALYVKPTSEIFARHLLAT